MSLSSPFIRRPVGTTLLTIAIMLAGALGYLMLPVAPLPQVEYPTISVSASLPGASPEIMASAVATPLERQLSRIAGVNEMTSASYLGSTSITLQFDLNRNIDAASRDVQAAINAARGNLPANLPSNPSYRKINPADAPIMILALMSDNLRKEKIYDAASSILQQKLSQVKGVGQVWAGGGSQPAVRVDVNPTKLNQLGLSLADVRTTLANANANRPKGQIVGDDFTWSLSTSDQLMKAAEYKPLIISYRDGAAVRLMQVADVDDSVENIRAGGVANGRPAVVMVIFRQPGANIIDTVDNIRNLLPQLESEIPADIDLAVMSDRTTTIRASVEEVQFTLMLSIGLVIMVIFLFLRNLRATLIPSVAVPVSLVGTFGVMHLCGYSIDNLSLMALTIATGFVVDDAIVVIENITRHLENGRTPLDAAFQGAKEIGFTVLSISLSLVAVFIPILLMGGIIGRLFREFAITLSVAIMVSLVVSLTTTPMMCAKLLKAHTGRQHGRIYRAGETAFEWMLALYRGSLGWVLRHQALVLLVTLGTIALTAYLYVIVPKGFFPQQDTGRLSGNLIADQDTSFTTMEPLLQNFVNAIMEDPAVLSVNGSIGGSGGGGGSTNRGRLWIALKPLEEREYNSADEVIDRLRKNLGKLSGGVMRLSSIQDLRIGGRSSSAQFQYTLRGDDLVELNEWGDKMLAKFKTIPGLADVDTDQQNRGLQTKVLVDRLTARRLEINQMQVNNTLYDAFGQRQVSTIYTPLNQYRVVMGVQPKFLQNPDALKHVRVAGATGSQVPLGAIARTESGATALSVNHSGNLASITLTFNLLPGVSLGEAIEKVRDAEAEMGLPGTIFGSFSGTAQAFEESLGNQPILILAALVTVYIVLGVLYESFIHPITILSTLPSAGVGAILALLLFGVELNVMALIGILLLIGIVKKNAIMMIDFALEAERQGQRPEAAIYEACLLRFRPITMTTMAALFGALPLALGTGTGAELRKPMGIAIVGGLMFSQLLTLYTTPVVYLYLDRLRVRIARWRGVSEVPLVYDEGLEAVREHEFAASGGR